MLDCLFPLILFYSRAAERQNQYCGDEVFHENMKQLEQSGVDLSTIAAFMVESYQGWGALFYPKNYIKALRKWADDNKTGDDRN